MRLLDSRLRGNDGFFRRGDSRVCRPMWFWNSIGPVSVDGEGPVNANRMLPDEKAGAEMDIIQADVIWEKVGIALRLDLAQWRLTRIEVAPIPSIEINELNFFKDLIILEHPNILFSVVLCRYG